MCASLLPVMRGLRLAAWHIIPSFVRTKKIESDYARAPDDIYNVLPEITAGGLKPAEIQKKLETVGYFARMNEEDVIKVLWYLRRQKRIQEIVSWEGKKSFRVYYRLPA